MHSLRYLSDIFHKNLITPVNGVSSAQLEMEPRKVLQWNTRASIVYAVGVWTMVGSYFYFKYTGKYDLPETAPTPKTEEMEAKNPNEVVYQTAHSKSVIIYKKDFVPYRIRLMNFIESFTGGAAPGDRDDGK